MIFKPQDENRTVSTDPGIGSGHAESSDGDSSTYGQIKTFESFFEGTSPVELIDVKLNDEDDEIQLVDVKITNWPGKD